MCPLGSLRSPEELHRQTRQQSEGRGHQGWDWHNTTRRQTETKMITRYCTEQLLIELVCHLVHVAIVSYDGQVSPGWPSCSYIVLTMILSHQCVWHGSSDTGQYGHPISHGHHCTGHWSIHHPCQAHLCPEVIISKNIWNVQEQLGRQYFTRILMNFNIGSDKSCLPKIF